MRQFARPLLHTRSPALHHSIAQIASQIRLLHQCVGTHGSVGRLASACITLAITAVLAIYQPMLAILVQAILVIQRQMYEEALRRLTVTDPLTLVANRRGFEQFVQRLCDLGMRLTQYTPCSVLSIAVDAFKELNDQHSHEAGDTDLCELAQIMATHVRKIDLVARLGGDEFCVICPGLGMSEAIEVARRIRRELTGFSISVGIDTFDQAHLPDNLLASPDSLLYSAKRTGRNRIVVASADGAAQVYE